MTANIWYSLLTGHQSLNYSQITLKEINMKTKYIKNISLLLIAIIFFNTTGQSQEEQKVWQWITSMGSTGWDYINGIKTDADGNVYIAGAYTATFSINKKDIESHGKQDLFVAKYNHKGTLQWVWNAGGKQADKITALYVNQNNEIIISGIVSGEMKIEKQTFEGESKKLILAKITGKGKMVWIKSFAIDNAASIYHLYENDSCGIIAAGTFKKTMTIGDKIVKSAGKEDIFMARFTSDGIIKNLNAYGANGKDVITALAGSENQKLYLAGTYQEGFTLGNVKLESPQQKSTGAFVAQINFDFETGWVQTYQSQQFIEISSIAPARNNELFIAGNFADINQLGNYELTSIGGIDFFAAKLDSAGQVTWAKRFGTPYSDYANNINLNPTGGIMLNGTFNDTLMLDNIRLSNVEGNTTAFISQINNQGEVFWAESIGGKTNVTSHHSTLDAQGNIFLSGNFTHTVQNPKFKISSKGNEDIYLAKYFNCPDYSDIIKGNQFICDEAESELKIKGDFENIIWNNGLYTGKKIIITQPGKYVVQMTDKNACLIMDTIEVKAAQNPLFTLGRDTVLFTDQSIILNGPQGLDNYLWFNNNSMPSQEVTALGNYNHKIDVWLQVTDNLNCQFTDSLELSFRPKSPMIDMEQVQELNVFPNPASDYLYWSLSCEAEVSLYLDITNIEGQLVYQQKIYNYAPNEEFLIPVGDLPQGIYYLSIGNGKEKISKMVVKN